MVQSASIHKLILNGNFSKYTNAKDLMFYLARSIRQVLAYINQWSLLGPGAKAMSIDERLTIAVHAVELGGKFGIFEYDEKQLRSLQET